MVAIVKDLVLSTRGALAITDLYWLCCEQSFLDTSRFIHTIGNGEDLKFATGFDLRVVQDTHSPAALPCAMKLRPRPSIEIMLHRTNFEPLHRYRAGF